MNDMAKAPGAIAYAYDADIPWVTVLPDVELKVLRVVEAQGLWVVRSRFAPGARIETHRHTGDVHGFTQTGCWHYEEYGIDYPAGTYIYEPANSVHTLRANADNQGPTEVLFIMRGANLVIGENGEVVRVDDGPTTLAYYYMFCEAQGFARPAVLLS